MTPDNKDGFWVGNFKGIDHINPKTGKVKRYGGKMQGVADIVLDKRDVLWAINWRSVMTFNPKKNKFNRRIDKLYKSSIKGFIAPSDLFRDSKKVMWIGGSRSVASYDAKAKTFKHFSPDTSFKENIGVNYIFEDSKKRFWLGTKKYGLLLFDRQTKGFTQFTLKDSLETATSVLGILEENENTLWMSTDNGLFKVNIPNNQALTKNTALDCQRFDLHDGLLSIEFNRHSVFKSNSGEMFFGTINGVNAFFPDQLKKYTSRIPVIISGFRINGTSTRDSLNSIWQSLQNNQTITLPYYQSNLSFDYVGLYFPNPKQVVYAYKLEGYDTQWNYVEHKDFIKLANLPRGITYRFRLKAKVGDGEWYECNTVPEIYIQHAFWETLWFRSIIALGIFLIFFIFYRVRMSAIQKQKIKLEAIVDKRTLELREKNEEVLKQSKELLQTNNKLYETQQEITSQNEELHQQAEELQQQRDYLKEANDTIQKTIRGY